MLFLLVYAGLAGAGAKLQLDAAQEFRQMKAALERGEEDVYKRQELHRGAEHPVVLPSVSKDPGLMPGL